MAKLRFGIVGAVHDHLWPVWGKGYIRELQASDTATVVAAADKNDQLVTRFREYGIEQRYSDYREMIQNEQLDAVIMGLPNDEKAEATELLAAKGIHILMDKPMAVNFDHASRIYKAAQENRIKLMVNWPSAWRPALHHARRLVDEGAIGRVFWAKARTANPGPELHGASDFFLEWLYDIEKNGGGALVDYCCYGIKYACWFLGSPDTVIATAAHLTKDNIPDAMEDNACVIMEYPDARAVSEGSWSHYRANIKMQVDPSTAALVLYGTKGVLLAAHKANYLNLVSEEYPEGIRIEADPLPSGRDNGPAYFISCILEDKAVEGMTSAKLALDVQEVMDAAYESISSGCKVKLPLRG